LALSYNLDQLTGGLAEINILDVELGNMKTHILFKPTVIAFLSLLSIIFLVGCNPYVSIVVESKLQKNVAPVATAQNISTNEDIAKSVTLSANDADGDTLTYSIISNPSHGTLSDLSSGSNVTYTPRANYHGVDSFTFKANDGNLDSDPETITINVTAIDDTPVATNITVTTDNDVAEAITLSGTDAEGTSLTYSIVNAPKNGVLSGTSPNLTYTPKYNSIGSDSFTYTVSDGVNTSSSKTVSVTVNNTIRQAPSQLLVTFPQTSLTSGGSSYHIHCDYNGGGLTAFPVPAVFNNTSKFKIIVRAIAVNGTASCPSPGISCYTSGGTPQTIELNPGEQKSVAVAMYIQTFVTVTSGSSAAFTGTATMRYAVNVLRDPGGYLGILGASGLSTTQWTDKFLPSVNASNQQSDLIFAERPEIYYESIDSSVPISVAGTMSATDIGCDG